MKKSVIYVFVLIALLVLPGFAQNSIDNLFTSMQFKDKAAGHVKKLSEIGIRPAGSQEEKQAALYIKKQLEAIGLKTVVEDFEFETFEFSNCRFQLGKEKFNIELLGFNPYDKVMNFSGNAYLYDPSTHIQGDEIENKTVVTTTPANYFQLMSLNPKMIIFLSPEDFKNAKALNVSDFSLQVNGKLKKEKSSNVTALLSSPANATQEIIITAHYDSYRNSPGANDNATGTAALIELARLFFSQKDKLSCNIRFVSFGCEEVGLLGSRKYLKKHSDDLNNCVLLFNVDTVGGDSEIYAEMLGGISTEFSERGIHHFPEYLMDKAWDSRSGKWMIMKPEILAPLFTASFVPDRVKEAIEATGRELQIKINPAKGLFSDQRIFAQAGIPSSGVAQKTGSKIIHSPDDIFSNVNIDLVEKAGKICYSVVFKIMSSLEEERKR